MPGTYIFSFSFLPCNCLRDSGLFIIPSALILSKRHLTEPQPTLNCISFSQSESGNQNENGMMTITIITMTSSPIAANTCYGIHVKDPIKCDHSPFYGEETKSPFSGARIQSFLPLNHILTVGWDATSDHNHMVTAQQTFSQMGLRICSPPPTPAFFEGVFRNGEGACFVTQWQAWKKRVFT